MSPIYLDYAATTPVDPRVAEKMHEVLTSKDFFGNASSSHPFGRKAKNAIENARADIADLIGADPSEIIWTSGATESNNLALKGVADLYQQKGKHIVTSKIEHPSVLETCQYLEKKGFSVTYVAPDQQGRISVDEIKESVRQDTILISIMHVNNEIGSIQEIERIADFTSSHGILFHVDAAQSVGKIEINLQETPIDLLACSAHKFYGPKGIGALYARKKPRVRVAAQLHGGGQELGMRSGTLPTHQIVGMGIAAALAKQEMIEEHHRINELRTLFLNNLNTNVKVVINGDIQNTLPGILNLRIKNLKANELIAEIQEIAFSTGSACHSKGIEPSSILRALNQTKEEAECGVRFSFGRFTTVDEINQATQLIAQAVKKLS